MPSVLETTTAIQDKFLEGLQEGQKSMVDAVKTWADMVESMSAKLPEFPVPDSAKPGELLQTAFGFTEKVLSSQREFFTQVFDAASPAMKMPAGPKATAAKATAKV